MTQIEIGRLLRAGTTGFIAGCRVSQFTVPAFGELVRAPLGDSYQVYGLAGSFEIGDIATGTTPGNFGENRATLHLHGGFTPWISDGTPHQWVSPKTEVGDYKMGVSTKGVPDSRQDRSTSLAAWAMER